MYGRNGILLDYTPPIPAGRGSLGEQAQLLASGVWGWMDRTRDRMVLDPGYFGFERKKVGYKLVIPPNRQSDSYAKASIARQKTLDRYDKLHKRISLGYTERWNREVKAFRILSDRGGFRHSAESFPRVLRDCLALRNAQVQERTREQAGAR